MESAPTQKIIETDYLHKKEAGWETPLKQSAITGFFFAGIPTIIMIRAKMQIVDILTWSLVIFFAVALIVWLFILWQWIGLTMERVTGRDLNGDGVIGKTGPEVTRSIRVDMHSTQNGYPQTTIARFPRESKLIAIAQAVIKEGAAFSFGEIVTNRGLCTQSEFKVIQEEMLAREIFAYKNPEYPKLGMEPTEAGRVMLTELINRPDWF